MLVTVYPSVISGTLQAPASKSSMQRACALALLHSGETIIQNPGKSNDDLAAIDIIRRLGASVVMNTPAGSEELKVKNENINHFSGEINCGESGLGIRMFTPIAALSSEEIIVHGAGSLLKRPMHFFDEVLPTLGVSVQSNHGYLPVKIKGPLQPADITIDGSLSSQFLTGLLIAYGKAATRPVTITVTDLKSRPYIDLTLQMMNDFGYHVDNNNYKSFLIKPQTSNSSSEALVKKDLKPQTIIIEGDWSGAAFLLVAAAITGSAEVKGLNPDSPQGDKEILQALKDSGAVVSISANTIAVKKNADKGRPFCFDATDCPDLFPPLVALAAYCNGTSVIKGVNRLQHKESNRSLSLQQEFGKMGVEIQLDGDEMKVTGGRVLKGSTVHSHHDHRIAMACAVAALKANGETVIEDAEAVSKSYPGFYSDLKMLGAAVSLPLNS